MIRMMLRVAALAVVAASALAVAALSACSSPVTAPVATDAGSSGGFGPSGDVIAKDDAGLERHSDGGLTDRGCSELKARVATSKTNAKSCANVPGVCQVTVKDECGCATFVEDPQNDYAKGFVANALLLATSGCTQKCTPCPDTDAGACVAPATGPMQCAP